MKQLILPIIASICAMPICLIAASHASSTADVKAQLEKIASSKASNGGIVTRPAQGRFAIVADQKHYDEADIRKAADILSGQLKFQVETVTNNGTLAQATATQLMKDMQLNIAIFLVSDESTPMSLVAMEERWAFINISKVLDKGTTPSIKLKRIRDELSRVAKALFVGANTSPGGMAAKTGSDLDDMTASPIDSTTLITMVRGLPSYGLVAPRTVPYRRACEEGWAPAPTNDVQKTIWNEVHQLPSKPIKIEYDPATGK